MNKEDALERARRLITPLVPEGDERYSILIDYVAKELTLVALECGWQRETVQQLTKMVEVLTRQQQNSGCVC